MLEEKWLDPQEVGQCFCNLLSYPFEQIAKELPQQERALGKAGYWAAPNRRPQRDLRYDRWGEGRANLFTICGNRFAED